MARQATVWVSEDGTHHSTETDADIHDRMAAIRKRRKSRCDALVQIRDIDDLTALTITRRWREIKKIMTASA